MLARFDELIARVTDWSWDGRYLAVDVHGPGQKTGDDIWIVPVSGEDGEKPHPFLASDYDEWIPTFSPDGKWLSYVSTESGRRELYVTPFPGPGSPSQVSVGGTGGGFFSGKGLEILYGNNVTWVDLMAVDLKAGAGGLEVG